MMMSNTNLKLVREELERRFKKMQDEISGSEQTLGAINLQIQERNDSLTLLDKHLERLAGNVSQIKDLPSTEDGTNLLLSQVQDLRADVGRASKAYQDQSTANQELVTDLRKKLDTSISVVDILRSKVQQLVEKEQQLVETNTELSTVVKELEKQKKSYEDIFAGIKTSSVELTDEIERITAEKEKLIKQVEQYGQQRIEPVDQHNIPTDSEFPWAQRISELGIHDSDLELYDESLDVDEFAKKTGLTPAQLKELKGLHAELIVSKRKLDKYFKTPPVARKDLEQEISVVQDAMVDIMSSASVKRVTTDKFVYSLRNIATHFKVISENKAVSSLEKKKLSRFIRTEKYLDMADLRPYLLEKDMTIPGLRKIAGDVSIYIYEKHEEGDKLFLVINPDGSVKFGEELEGVEEKELFDDELSFFTDLETPSFRGEYNFLSNFHPAKVTYEGITYPTAEHAYQAAKTLDTVERETIKAASTPGKAKRLGQKITIRKGWDGMKVDVMEKIVKQKFVENPSLAKKLVTTRGTKLIEKNWWGDTFWGTVEGKGQNNLGKILTKVRGHYADKIKIQVKYSYKF